MSQESIKYSFQENEVAAAISNNIQPQLEMDLFPERRDIDLYVHKDIHKLVGGDFFDYYFLDDSKLVLTMGDVACLGVDAVIAMTTIRTCIKDMVLQGLSPKDVMTKVNKRAFTDHFAPDDAFVSVWLGILNTSNGELVCVDAGHTAPIIRHHDSHYEYLRAHKNMPLLAQQSALYKETVYHLEIGDRLCLFTNGINAAKNSENIHYGKTRIKEYLNIHDHDSQANIIQGIVNDVDNFTGLSEIEDDRIISLLDFNQYRDIRLELDVLDSSAINKYGGVDLPITRDALLAAGFEFSDLLRVSFSNKSVVIPFVPEFRYLTSGASGVLAMRSNTFPTMLMTFGGSFAAENNIVATDFPMHVVITLEERYGYYNTFVIRDLKRTNKREDYSHLSDAEYANFREINLTGFGNQKLYRGSSPINPGINRFRYADEALKLHNVKTVINLDNSYENVKLMGGYDNSYYSTIDYHCFNLDTDYESENTHNNIKEIFKVMANYPTPIYVHCIEGQDRTGLIMAITECLMGSTYREIVDDYMKTFYNYYGVERGTPKFTSILTNLLTMLENAFGTDALSFVNLHDLAVNYLLKIGLTADEIAKIQKNLA